MGAHPRVGRQVRVPIVVGALAACGLLASALLGRGSVHHHHHHQAQPAQAGPAVGATGAIHYFRDGQRLQPTREETMLMQCVSPANFADSASVRAFSRISSLIDAELLNHFGEALAIHGRPAHFSVEHKRQFLGWVTQTFQGSSQSADKIRDVLNSKVYSIPSTLHAMSGEKFGYVTGGLYSADTILDGLVEAGFLPLTSINKALDFGGSTGRATLAMSWAYPSIEMHVSDPIRKSIGWVDQNLPGIHGYASPLKPKMKYNDGEFDLVFAVSIWSHYNPQSAALEWFDEMHRIIRPGGALIVTTHGWPSMAHHLQDYPLRKIMAPKMENEGYYFRNVFANNIDWDPDTKSADWGNAFIDNDWLRRKVEPKWRLWVVLPGRSDCNQDVVVLERMAET